MYYRITRYKADASKRAAAMDWIDSMKSKIAQMGATHIDFVEFGPGEWANVALFPSKREADAALEQAIANFREAAQKGFVDPSSVQRSEGEVIRRVGG